MPVFSSSRDSDWKGRAFFGAPWKCSLFLFRLPAVFQKAGQAMLTGMQVVKSMSANPGGSLHGQGCHLREVCFRCSGWFLNLCTVFLLYAEVSGVQTKEGVKAKSCMSQNNKVAAFYVVWYMDGAGY